MSASETSLKIFKHYKLKPSFPIMIKDNKKKDRAGVGDKPPPPSFVRSINPNFIQKLIRSEMDQFRFDPMWSILIQLDYVFDIVWSNLEIVDEWVMNRRPFWIKIMHISPILLGRFCDKKSWKLLSVLCSLWGIYAWENLQCVFSLQTLQCAMFWFSLKLA